VFAAIGLDLFAVLFGGAVALLPVLAKDRFGVDAVGLGVLRAAGGLGAVAAAIVLAVRPLRSRVGWWLYAVIAIFGCATIVLGVTRNFFVAVAMMVVLMAADMVSVSIRSTMLPLVTPAGMRGRVGSIEGVCIGASNELGAFESGVTAAVLGVTASIVSGGIVTLLVVMVWCVLFPQLLRVRSYAHLSSR
jgi:hypothetical protein